jgi:hypothetical protein
LQNAQPQKGGLPLTAGVDDDLRLLQQADAFDVESGDLGIAFDYSQSLAMPSSRVAVANRGRSGQMPTI